MTETSFYEAPKGKVWYRNIFSSEKERSRFGSCNQATVCTHSRKNDCGYCVRNDWSGGRKKEFVWE